MRFFIKHYLILKSILIINTSSAQVFNSVAGGTDGPVTCLFADTINNKLHVGGYFNHSGGLYTTCNSVWNNSAWDSTRNQFGGTHIRSFTKYNNEIYAGGPFGLFDSLGNIISGLVRWDTSSSYWVSVGGNPQVVERLFVHDSLLYVVGGFDSIGGIQASKIATFDGVNWNSFPVLDSTTSGFRLMNGKYYNGELYVGGNFIGNGNNLNDIAKFNSSQWQPVGIGLSGINTIVYDFEIFQSKLIVGGYFKTIWGDPGNSIAAWDGSQWSQLGAGVGQGEVKCMAIYQNELWAGGNFQTAGGVSSPNLAKWDGTQWVSSGILLSNTVHSLEVFNNSLYIGGGFGTILNNDTIWYILKYNSTTGFEAIPKQDMNLTIYPNPVTTELKMECINIKSGLGDITIYNSIGQVVYSACSIPLNHAEFDVRHLPTGVYHLRVYAKDGEGGARFVKR